MDSFACSVILHAFLSPDSEGFFSNSIRNSILSDCVKHNMVPYQESCFVSELGSNFLQRLHDNYVLYLKCKVMLRIT